MSLRTPNTTQTRQVLLDLERTKQRLALNNARIATGKQIVTPGDDPSGAAMILDLGHSIGAYTQASRQVDSASAYLNATQDSLALATNLNLRLQEITASALGNSATPSSLAALAPEVDAIRKNLLDLANTQVQGKYIFAGALTQTQPFTAATPPAAATYNGDSGVLTVGITSSTSVDTNVPGDTVFLNGGANSATNFMETVAKLQDALVNGPSSQIQTAATNLKAILDHLNSLAASVGGRISGLNQLQQNLSDFKLSLQTLQNSKAETDYPTAITEFTNDQTIQQATLSALAKTSKTNLFDYLG